MELLKNADRLVAVSVSTAPDAFSQVRVTVQVSTPRSSTECIDGHAFEALTGEIDVDMHTATPRGMPKVL